MKILVSAESFGYGPITTGLNIVKELKKYNDVKLDFIGSGIAMEQAKMSGYFENYYLCDTYDFMSLEKSKSIFEKYHIFLSSENVNGAIFALKNGIKNTYYVDNLMWMWDKIPDGLLTVKKYFISEIIPSKENFNKIGKKILNPIFVGPVRKIEVKKCSTKNQIIINLGGAESFLLEHSLIVDFYNKLLNEILSTELVNSFDSIIICGGSGVINSIKLKKSSNKIKKCTLSHEAYLLEMERSSHCILASGLGNFIETVGKYKNIMYLPAINYSQLQQLEYYKKQNFGFKALNWDNFEFYKQIPKFLDEETGVNLVVSNIKEYLKNNYTEKVSKVVKEFLIEKQDAFFETRKDYINNFSKSASSDIAKTIYTENKGGEDE